MNQTISKCFAFPSAASAMQDAIRADMEARARREAPMPDDTIDLKRRAILRYLEAGPSTQGRIRSAIRGTGPLVLMLLADLVEDGLVEREIVPNSRIGGNRTTSIYRLTQSHI